MTTGTHHIFFLNAFNSILCRVAKTKFGTIQLCVPIRPAAGLTTGLKTGARVHCGTLWVVIVVCQLLPLTTLPPAAFTTLPVCLSTFLTFLAALPASPMPCLPPFHFLHFTHALCWRHAAHLHAPFFSCLCLPPSLHALHFQTGGWDGTAFLDT